MTIFEKNIEVMRKSNPEFTMYKDDTEQGTYNVAETKSGVKTLRYSCNAKLIHLHSKFDPEREGADFVNAFSEKIKKSNVIVLFGMGFGYAAKAMRQKKPKETILVLIEPSWSAFTLAMEYMDLQDILSDDNIALIVGKEEDVIESNLRAILNVDNYDNVLITFHPTYKEIYAEEARILARIISQIVRSYKVNDDTIYLRALDWTKITTINTKHIIESKSLTDFKNIFAGRPAIMVGAGPSLNKNIDLLHKAKGRIVIIATYTALRALQKKNITPDFVFTLDSKQTSRETEEEKKQPIHIPVAFLSIANTSLLERCVNGKIYCRTEYDNILENILPHEKRVSNTTIYMAGTVSISAMDLAVHMGANPVIFIGQDLAFTGKKTHAAGTVYADDEKVEKKIYAYFDKLFVDSIDGGKIESSPQFSVYIECMEEYMKFYSNVKFIDATEGGALKRGAEISTLENVLERYNELEENVSEIVQKVFENKNHYSEEDKQYVIQNIMMQKELLLKMQQYVEAGLQQSDKLEKMYTYGNPAEKHIKSAIKKFTTLDKKMNQVLEQTKIFSIVYDALKIKMKSHLLHQEKTKELYFIRHSQMLYEYMGKMCSAILLGLDTLAESLATRENEK